MKKVTKKITTKKDVKKTAKKPTKLERCEGPCGITQKVVHVKILKEDKSMTPICLDCLRMYSDNSQFIIDSLKVRTK